MSSQATIKMLTGFSDFGGSTMALVDLCNFFNSRRFSCTLYGPHEWHLGRCPSARLDAYSPEPTDRLVIHMREVPVRPHAHTSVIYCHEKHMFPVRRRKVQGCDAIVFVSESQRQWHNVDGVIIPNLSPRLDYKHELTSANKGVAGVIGTVHPSKRTHESIRRALDAGYRQVVLYGNAVEPYMSTIIRPMLGQDVAYKGVMTDKRAMYQSVEAVFHMSESECASLVQQECHAFGIPFFGNGNAILEAYWSDDSIFNAWKSLLRIESDWIDQTHLAGTLGRQDSQAGWQSWFGSFATDSSILDVGAGLGFSKARLAGKGNRVTLQDVAPHLAVDINDQVDTIPSKSFDYVTAFDVIEHVFDDAAFLRHLARICRKGVYVTTPNYDHSRNANLFHVREYTPAHLWELASMLGRCRLYAGDSRGAKVRELDALEFLNHQSPHHAFLWATQ